MLPTNSIYHLDFPGQLNVFKLISLYPYKALSYSFPRIPRFIQIKSDKKQPIISEFDFYHATDKPQDISHTLKCFAKSLAALHFGVFQSCIALEVIEYNSLSRLWKTVSFLFTNVLIFKANRVTKFRELLAQKKDWMIIYLIFWSFIHWFIHSFLHSFFHN